jgi:hypothetical protein
MDWIEANWNWNVDMGYNLTGMYYHSNSELDSIFGAIGKDDDGFWVNKNGSGEIYRPEVENFEELKKFAEVVFRMED